MIVKSDIVDWLISNKPLIDEIKDDLNSLNKDSFFIDEYYEQFNDELKREVFNHITNDLGCTIEDIHDKLEDKELDNFLRN